MVLVWSRKGLKSSILSSCGLRHDPLGALVISRPIPLLHGLPGELEEGGDGNELTILIFFRKAIIGSRLPLCTDSSTLL